MDNDKTKMSKTSVDKSEEMDVDEDPCSDEDVENGTPMLDDDEDDEDDDEEDDDDNEDMDDDPDYHEEDGSRVSTEAASISVDETSSNQTPLDVPIKTEGKSNIKRNQFYQQLFNRKFIICV